MRKSPKYLITGVLACILIVIIAISYKNTVIKENISNVKSIEKSINSNLKKSSSSDKILNKPFVKTTSKQIKKNKNLFDSKAVTFTKNELTEREKYEQFLMNHPFNNRKRSAKTDSSAFNESGETIESKEQESPRLAYEQDFLRTMNPTLQRPTPEVLQGIMFNNAVKQFSNALMGLPGASGNHSSWNSRGPKNVGGRTRALAWDPNDVTRKKVWAGSVSGGLWYNNDIIDSNSQWLPINDMWPNLGVTKIVFDPNNSQNIYVSTGEICATSVTRGAGIWKSVDAGVSWTWLSSTVDMTYINDLEIRNESGTSVLYAAVDDRLLLGAFSNNSNGLYRSINGGTSWTQVMKLNSGLNGTGVPYTISSISIAADNRLWVGTKNTAWATSTLDQGGGKILYSIDGLNWTKVPDFTTVKQNDGDPLVNIGRVTIATAPSNSNYLYAFIERGYITSLYSIAIFRSVDKGLNWTEVALPDDADNDISPSDFSRGQAAYDQVLKVDPANENIVYVGAINLFKTTNAGLNWIQISKWSDNPGMGAIARLSDVHADQHAMVFKPGTSNTALFANDGGIYYTTNLANATSSNVIESRNNNYNVTQFYAAAMHPSAGKNYYLAGAQDNGTQQFSNAGLDTTKEATGGDGAYCFIDQLDPSYQVTSYFHNNINFSNDGGDNFVSMLSEDNSGSFINPACYDNSQHLYFSYKSTNGINGVIKKITGIVTFTPVAHDLNISGLSSPVTAFKVSPYTTSSTTLFIGTASGKLLKVINANGSHSTTVIPTAGFPTGSISSIDIGTNENELLVTFFNYGVDKIWYTNNGGASWLNKKGNYPDMPARWGMFNPNNRTNDVILATELGIYGTLNFSSTSPTWTQLNNGFANVRTDMLQYRPSDNQMIASTYGRGLYSSMGFVSAPTITSFSPTTAGTGTQVTIDGTELGSVTTVSFGGVAASTFTVTSSTRIIASVGNGASGNASVTNPANTAIKTGFTYCLTSDANLSSGVNSNNQTVCQNTSIVNITFATTNITGGSTLGLPPGLTASLSSNVLTISGSPTTAGTYSYTINLMGGCQTIIETGTITVTASNTIILSSATGTNAQAACINNPIANITYTTTAATGALVTGLPTGVSKIWAANMLTISGTPTASGVFTYTINLTGGCSSVTTFGTINVSSISVAGTASASISTICSGNTTTLSLTGNTGSIIWQQSSNGTTGWVNVTTGTGINTSSYTTAALSATSYFRALVTNGACSSVASNVLIINVNETPSSPIVSYLILCKDVAPVTMSATAKTGNSLLWYGTNATAGTGVATASVANTSTIGTFNYYVSQITALGCESPRTKLVATINDYPLTPAITRDGASNLVSSNAYGNKWYKDLVLLPDTTKSIKPTAAANYSVLTTQNFCVSKMSSAYYYVNTITDVVNLNLNEFIKVYPNPIVNQLKIDFNLKKYSKLNIGIYNTTSGNKVIDLNSKSSGMTIDVSQLPIGTYIVVVSSSDNQLYYKEKIMKL